MMDTLLVILLAYLDRMRGTGNISLVSGDTRLLMGWTVAAMFGHAWDWMTVPIAVLFAAGEAPGWGSPLNAVVYGKRLEPERWQVGPLAQCPVLAAVVRGAMWGAPVGLLAWWDTDLLWLPAIMAVTMPAAAELARLSKPIQHSFIESRLWPRMEYLRGLLTGIAIIILT